ncbi:MAG: anhydro-N-acetylmuramic acid kinase [Nevskiales bacterium]|nr:anhydro-N-acetylmuramic acid kinase [Nevskiales bacterium]
MRHDPSHTLPSVKTGLYLGLMSGTSQNGVDAAVVAFDRARFDGLVATHTVRYPPALRRRLLKLAGDAHTLALHDYCELDLAVARVFVRAALGALKKGHISPHRITAIGSHGQTVFHAARSRGRGSLQLGDPNVIAAQTGITTVADFRRKDLALGGHGAPLVPAFHYELFAATREARAVINIGGIANLTVLPNRRLDRVTGFDTGPGNALMDEWSLRHRQRVYDAGGRWAASGHADHKLLDALLSDPYFRQIPPKSTGRGYFNLCWAQQRYPALTRLPAEVVQNTFAELTARSIADAVERYARQAARLLVCGGGVRNRFLMQQLQTRLPSRSIELTDAYGLTAQWVEAAAFAWLALRTMKGLPGNVPTVTGARRAAVLGGIYKS